MRSNGQNMYAEMFFVVLTKLLISLSCFNQFFPQTYLRAKTFITGFALSLEREILLMMEKIMNYISGPTNKKSYVF